MPNFHEAQFTYCLRETILLFLFFCHSVLFTLVLNKEIKLINFLLHKKFNNTNSLQPSGCNGSQHDSLDAKIGATHKVREQSSLECGDVLTSSCH